MVWWLVCSYWCLKDHVQTLKMEEVISCKMLVKVYLSTHHVPEYSNLQQHCCKHLDSHTEISYRIWATSSHCVSQSLVIQSIQSQHMNFICLFLFSTTYFTHTADHYKVEKHRYRRKSSTRTSSVTLFFLYLCFPTFWWSDVWLKQVVENKTYTVWQLYNEIEVIE